MKALPSIVKTTLPALLLCGTASADVITWGAPQDAMTSSDVSTNGTLVTALNPWAQTFASPTVNGVTFTAFAPIGWGGGGWDLMQASLSGDSGYDTLLDTARVTDFGTNSNPTDWGAIRLDTLGTLTMGNQYEIQVWFCDQRIGTATNILNDRTMVLSSAVGAATLSGGVITNLGSVTQGPNSGALEADPNNSSGASDAVFGQFATGTFTRTSTDPLYLLVMGVHPVAISNLKPHINAFQVRDVTGATVGTPFCDPMDLNSTGQSTTLSGTFGSGVGSDLHLESEQGPNTQFGYFLIGTGSSDPGIVISQGRLCLDVGGGNSFGRYNVTGGALNSVGQFDAAGVFQNFVGTSTVGTGFDVPVTVPTSGSPQITVGSTWHFQLWHREAGGASNFSNGLSVTFP